MPAASLLRNSIRPLLALVVLIGLTGCAGSSGNGSRRPSLEADSEQTRSSETADAIRILETHLVALDWRVRTDEAHQVAVTAVDYSQQLAREYRLVRPPLFHNFLVNFGLKKRGLCYHWTEDLIAQLEALHVSTLELRWAIARAGTLREHNAVVITARGQDFEAGIVLDSWRRSGSLIWLPVSADHYPWEEGEYEAPAASSAVPAAQAAHNPR